MSVMKKRAVTQIVFVVCSIVLLIIAVIVHLNSPLDKPEHTSTESQNSDSILSLDANYPSPVIQLQQALAVDELDLQYDIEVFPLSESNEPPILSPKLVELKQKLKQLQSMNQ